MHTKKIILAGICEKGLWKVIENDEEKNRRKK